MTPRCIGFIGGGRVTIRSEWLKAFLRERGGRVFVVEGLFVVG